jgi:hypothetical protein
MRKQFVRLQQCVQCTVCMAGNVRRAFAAFGQFLESNGVALLSGIGVLGAGAAASYVVGTTVQSLREGLKLEKALRERDRELADACMNRAVSEAKRETMQMFLQLGFTQEYQEYQHRLHKQNNVTSSEK